MTTDKDFDPIYDKLVAKKILSDDEVSICVSKYKELFAENRKRECLYIYREISKFVDNMKKLHPHLRDLFVRAALEADYKLFESDEPNFIEVKNWRAVIPENWKAIENVDLKEDNLIRVKRHAIDAKEQMNIPITHGRWFFSKEKQKYYIIHPS